MSQPIFSEAWFQLAAKEKKEQLETKMLGLKPTIIYLDDELEALDIFESRCQEFGIEAFTSDDPERALEFIKNNKARVLLIVSDYQMPKGNGFDFRKQVSEISQEIPFFILSGFVTRELALEGVQLKISGFLDKPLKKEKFIELIKTEGEARATTIRDEYEMLKSFTDDVVNIIAEIEENCLHLESEPNDVEAVSRVFGLVHTVKGSSGFFEPRTLHLFAHSFEEILKAVQSGQKQISTPLISSWLKACDIIKTLNEEFITGNHKGHDVEELKKVLKVSDSAVSEVAHTEAASEAKTVDKKATEAKVADIKVSMRVLDEFTHVSGELTVIRNMINKVVGAIEKQYPGDKDVQVLSELLDEMHKINSDMQSKITDIRRVPASQLIKPLSRNLRDTSKALGKEVDFVVKGEELRLDNAIADTLSRCLVHLMRNSLDHGLESNEERVKINKPSKGKLTLKFESINESIVVSLEDDGRGINTDKIRQKVVSQGLRSQEAANQMSDEELHLMIFEAGFSTAAQVTEFSGRGVGMSMVRESIEQQKGKIKIHSVAGKGSRFILEIPIPKSVLITNCLFVETGGMTFGIPQEFVIRVMDESSMSNQGVEKLGDASFIRFEGNIIPVVSLKKSLELDQESHDKLLIVLDTQEQVFALEVSQVFDTEDAVIKPLTVTSLKSLNAYLGGTFLGDGTVGLIIDVPGMAKRLSLKKAERKVEEHSESHLLNTRNVISFSLAMPGHYAIEESDIFRVEVMNADGFTRSGNNYVMPYRNSMLSLVQLDNTVFEKDFKKLEESQYVPTLIVTHGDQYLGLQVQEIKDLEPVEMNVIPMMKKHPGVLGNLVHKEGSLTLLNVGEIKELYVQRTVEAIDEEDENLDEAA